ncbi:MAG: S8 family serine peptidase [Wenzhouxiangellaceae bacterium]
MLFLCSLHVQAGEAGGDWLRISQPDNALRAQLPAEAIDYGSFVWMPADSAGRVQPRADAVRVKHPFRMTAGERQFDPVVAFPEGASEWFLGSEDSDPDFRLVQFHGPIKPEWLEALRGAGVEPVQYRHPYSYVVWAKAEDVIASRNLPAVRWAGEFLPAFRVPVQARQTDRQHPYSMALVYRPAELQAVNGLAQAGAGVISVTPLNTQFSVVELRAAPQTYLNLARVPGVFTIQQIGQDAGLRGEMSNQSIVGGIDTDGIVFPGYLDWLAPTGLDGSGVIVGIVDGGMRESHQDLIDNVVPCLGTRGSCTTANDNHGTHVAGAVAGTGNSGVTDSLGFLRGQGVAPGASLVQQRFGPLLGSGPGGMVPEGMLRIYRDSTDSGAIVTNNSWGPTASPQGYDIPTMEIDMITRDADPDTPGQQAVLPVWSIMNGNGDSAGACAPSSLGSPDEAKNLFAVGSTNLQTVGGDQISDLFSVSSNSGHGPACDGRTVPHIVAPGCQTDSTSSSGDAGHTLLCGTSMASPVVTGAVAVFIEQYRNEQGSAPSPALVKAIFTAAAVNLVGNTDADGQTLGHRPDRKQGWGRIDLDAVIKRDLPLQTVDQEIVFDATGDRWTQTFTPADPAQPMRVMLAWTDAPGPGTGGTTPAWVNDLDLIATLGSDVFFGNNVDPDTGFSQTGGTADGMNNLEGLVLHPNQHLGGPVALEVLAANLAGDGLDPWTPGNPRQDFALACLNCLSEPDFTIAFEPAEAAVCIPESVAVAIEIGAVLGFDDPVNLSVSSVPVGVSASLSQTTVTPPGMSQLGLDVAAAAPLGSQQVAIEATSSSGAKARSVALGIFDEAPGQPALLGPEDGAFNVPRTLLFEWSPVNQAGTYLLEVASDPDFTNTVFEATTTETALEVDVLFDSASEFFWRVSVANACGGAQSETSRFTTQPEPGDCPIGTEAFTAFEDDMEAGEGEWVVAQDNGAVNNTWALTDTRSFVGNFSWDSVAVAQASDQRLVSPAIGLPGTPFLPLTLRFQNWREIEVDTPGQTCWHGAILEISTNDGASWIQVQDEDLLSQPYDGTINDTNNPLSGLAAWCDQRGQWSENVVDLSAWAGEEIRLRFRYGTDAIGNFEGWNIDDLSVEGCGVFEEVIFADGFEAAPGR